MSHPLDDETPPLGVMAPDSARTILVIGHDGDLAVALRDRLDRAYAVVKDVRPEEAAEGFISCHPWPWMVVGNVATLPDDVVELFQGRPILTCWWGPVVPGLPGHTRSFERFAELAAEVERAFHNTVEGMTLAIGLGVTLPDGGYARSAELQALVAAHPHPFDVPLDAFRSATRVLASHNIPLKPVRDAEDGAVRLAHAVGMAP